MAQGQEKPLTTAQRATLAQISAGRVYQQRFGYGAWRIQGASPTVVGRLISLGLAEWGDSENDRTPCAITEAGKVALEAEGGR